MKSSLKVAGAVLVVLYPVFVFLCLVVFKLPLSIMGLGMLILATVYFASNSKGMNKWTPICLGVIAITVLITKAEVVLKFYPICITAVFLVLFGGSLLRKDPIVVRFATMMDKSINVHPARKAIYRYCRNVTAVWVVWFIISECINVYLTFWGTTELWAIFNAGVSYIFQGGIFVVEYLVRLCVNRNLARTYTLSRMTEGCHPKDYVLCHIGTYEQGISSPETFRTWENFTCDVNRLGTMVEGRTRIRVRDLYLFNVAVCACLASNGHVELAAEDEENVLDDRDILSLTEQANDEYIAAVDLIDSCCTIDGRSVDEVEPEFDFLKQLWSKQGFDETQARWTMARCLPAKRLRDYFRKETQ